MNFSASPYIVHFNEATLLQTDSRNASHHAEFPVVAWRTGVESKGPRVDNLSIYNYKHSIEIIEGSLNRNFRQYGHLKSRVE